ncbi:hypothetical protein FM106_18900 [Brachybacterium faecium]|nr:hypothetical protein FM106_18900 [Brachybacterium faecium]
MTDKTGSIITILSYYFYSIFFLVFLHVFLLITSNFNC